MTSKHIWDFARIAGEYTESILRKRLYIGLTTSIREKLKYDKQHSSENYIVNFLTNCSWIVFELSSWNPSCNLQCSAFVHGWNANELPSISRYILRLKEYCTSCSKHLYCSKISLFDLAKHAEKLMTVWIIATNLVYCELITDDTN